MKTNEKDNWIEDVLNSMDGAAKAVPGNDLLGRIENRILLPVYKGKTISLTAVSAAAACILILLTLNIYFATRHKTNLGNNKDEIRELVQYYDITNDKNVTGL